MLRPSCFDTKGYQTSLDIGASLQKYEETSCLFESGCTEIHTKNIKQLK